MARTAAQHEEVSRAHVLARTNAHFIGDAGAEAYWTLERFESESAALPATGVTGLMCHPGYRPEVLKSGSQRAVEQETFLHPRARQVLERAGITPTGFNVLTSGFEGTAAVCKQRAGVLGHAWDESTPRGK